MPIKTREKYLFSESEMRLSLYSYNETGKMTEMTMESLAEILEEELKEAIDKECSAQNIPSMKW